MLSQAKKQKVIIVLVGLPARGKSFLSKKLKHYLFWIGLNAKIFNIGNYRRDHCGTNCKADFFDPNNQEAANSRKQMASLALDDLIDYLKNQNGHIAIYDGTNTTRERRKMIKHKIEQQFPKCELFFVESICDDNNLILQNIIKTKVTNPDYVSEKEEEAVSDFLKRIENYSKVYQTIAKDEQIPYLKLINVQTDFEIHQVFGYLQQKIIHYLMNLHIHPREIYLVRHGISHYDRQGRVGGDSSLHESAHHFLKQLKQFFVEEFKLNKNQERSQFQIFTGTTLACVETMEFLKDMCEPIYIKNLDQINAGLCDGLTQEQIEQKYPQELSDRQKNKLEYRFPRGESYMDIIHRIEPIIFEIERSKIPVVIVSHRPILRCLYGYFCNRHLEEIPTLNIPFNTVIKLTPETYLCKEEQFTIQEENEEIQKMVLTEEKVIKRSRFVSLEMDF